MLSCGAVVCHHTRAELLVIFSGIGPATTWGSLCEERCASWSGQDWASRIVTDPRTSDATKITSSLLISPGVLKTYVWLRLDETAAIGWMCRPRSKVACRKHGICLH